MARVTAPSSLVRAITCDGSNGTGINCGSSPAYNLTTGWISCWFLAGQNTTLSNENVLILNNAGFTNVVQVYVTSGTQILKAAYHNGISTLGSGGQYIYGWHNILNTWDATSALTYIDGALAGTVAGDASLPSDVYSLCFGSVDQAGDGLRGLLSRMAIGSAKLALADAQALFAGVDPSSRAGFVAQWPTDDGAGSMRVVGSGNVGILGSGASWVSPLGRVATPAATNLITWSSVPSDGAWGKVKCSVSGNTLTDINDGAMTYHYVQEVSIPALTNKQVTFVVWAKSGTLPAVNIQDSSSGTPRSASFDLTTGTVGYIGASATAANPTLVDGWWRCAVTFIAANCTPAIVMAANAAAIVGGTQYQGNGSGTVQILQWQVFPGPDTFPPYAATTSVPVYARIPVSGRVAASGRVAP